MSPHFSNPDAPVTTGCTGIDVGSRWLHAVALEESQVVGVGTFAAADLTALVAWTAAAPSVAVDAPDQWSAAPHAADEALSPKFRNARCAEIGLGAEHRLWVSWTTPTTADRAPEWMRVGVNLFGALRAAGHDPVEVYPFAAFRTLAGRRLAPKRTAMGLQQRLALLAAAGVGGLQRLGTAHDFVDAAVAALVASQRLDGGARPASCGHDGTAIWLPSAPGVAEAAGPPLR